MKSVFFTALLLAVSSFIASRQLPAQAVASMSQRVHPVLLRKEHNSLLRVAVEVREDTAVVELRSVTIGLDGTDDLSDLAALELFYTGEKQVLSTERSFGKLLEPSKTATFKGKLALKAGRHHFWLSVRLQPDADLLHEVDARCIRIDTAARESIAPTDRTPGVRKRIGVALRKHNDDGVHTHRIPALTRTPAGTLLCVYDMRRRKSRDLQEDIDIGLSRSIDGGRTWEPPRVIMDMGEWGGLPEEQNGCSDPGIVVDRNTGEVFCSAVWMWGKPGKHQWNGDGSEPGFEIGKTAQFVTVRSRDDGITWSQPVNRTRLYKREEWWLFAPSPSAGITLTDGTLVMPSQGRDKDGTPFSNLMISRDHGKTWNVSNPAFTGSSECQAVQLGDGSLMLNMRNERSKRKFYRSVCVTDDLGTTWRTHSTHQKALIEPNCNGSLVRVRYEENGASRSVLLFANPHARDGRHHHTLQASFDDGKTWPEAHRLLLDEGSGRGYPSITQIDAKHIGIVYEGSQADLVFEKIELAVLSVSNR